jgi:hypothetical protein
VGGLQITDGKFSDSINALPAFKRRFLVNPGNAEQ